LRCHIREINSGFHDITSTRSSFFEDSVQVLQHLSCLSFDIPAAHQLGFVGIERELT
jgi:hypothetical protein